MKLSAIDKYKQMSREVKASTSYTLCSVIQKGLSFITLPLFTRLLTTAQYGQYTVYSSWMSILTIFITLNLAYGTFQTAMVKYESERDQYTSSIGALFGVLGCLFLIVYLPLQSVWNKLFELPTVIMIFMVIEIVFNGITDCWLSKNRFEYKYKSVIAITLGKAFASPLFAFLLVINFEQKGYARIIGYALVNIIFGFLLYLSVIKKGKTLFNKTYWRYAFAFNIPLIPYYVSQMVFNASDRIMISYMKGTDQAAIYGVAYSLAIVLNFIISAINGSYAPWFMMQLKNNNTEKNKKVSLNLSIIVALGLWIIIAIAPEFITIMAGKDYASGVWAVPPVAISILLLFYTQLFDRILFFYEKKYLLVVGGIAPCILNLVLNYCFIPIFGFVAAAYTTLASYVLFVVINYFTSMKVLRDNQLDNKSMYSIKGLIFLFLALCVMTAIAMLLYNYIYIRMAIIIAILMIIVINKNSIMVMLKLE